MLGGLSGLGEDLIPHGMAYADNGRKSDLQGLNLVGLKRANYDKKDIQEAIHFYKDVFESKESGSVIDRANKEGEKYLNNKIIQDIVAFLNTDTNRRFCTPAIK